MALRERTILDQRVSAVKLLKQGVSVQEVAARFGVSRQAVYEWRERERAEGEAGLRDRSRRPRSSPSRTSETVEQRLIAERKQNGFGAKKIRRRLQDAEPEREWPARSTIDAVLKRAGLVKPRRGTSRGPFAPAAAERSYEGKEAGQVMTIDYKGQFRLGSGRYCWPLTIADPVSRFLLACDAYEHVEAEQVWSSLCRVFREHGMPHIVHSDNGIPFGTSGRGRFSTVSVRLMKYGIQPVYSRPGHPEDNGRHERMHRTLLEHTLLPPERTLRGQQARFDRFRRMFNEERPHEGIGLDRPLARHRPSPTPFPQKPPVLHYPAHFETIIIDGQGRLTWSRKRLLLSGAFANEPVGFERLTDSLWRLHYGSFIIGTFDEDKLLFS